MRIFEISEDIEVILCNSRTIRSADTFFTYDGSRYVNTFIRIKNVEISFNESMTRVGGKSYPSVLLRP